MSGALSTQMAAHILAMNAIAPLVVWYWPAVRRSVLPFGIIAASVFQIVVLWGWHLPSAMNAASANFPLGVLMQITLFLSALFFWGAVFREAAFAPWLPVGSLLVTGKLFCLLGVLLVFAPRPLYSHHALKAMPLSDMLAEQQLAGLIMIIACPLTYVVGSLVIVNRWFASAEKAGGWQFRAGEP